VTAAFLVPCLVELRREYNVLSPDRDKGADGWIGDAAHQATTSDHNPDSQGRVLAVDVDSTGPWPVPFADTVAMVVGRCRSGREDRLEYLIWDRGIYSRSYGWVKRVYIGADPHTGHAHFSARHDHHGQDDVRGWNLLSLLPKEYDEMATKAEIKDALRELMAEDVTPYVGGPGDRIHAAGWRDISRDAKLDYLLELRMTEPGENVVDRLARIEEKLDALATPPPAV
jgi:hypothetical protein